jgi:hypothetical protein
MSAVRHIIKVFVVEFNILIKLKNYLFPDIYLRELFLCFDVKN